MRRRFLSSLLALCMILSMVPITLSVSADGSDGGTYYVMYQGNGDGTSPTSPLGSLKSAVEKIEADSTVSQGVIYVVSNPEYDTIEKQIPANQKQIHYLAWDLNEMTWQKPISFRGNDANSASTITHRSTTGTGDFIIGGPCSFADLTLFLTRPNDEGFASSGQNVTISDTVLFKALSADPYFVPSAGGWDIKESATKTPNDGFFRFGSGRGSSTGEGARTTIAVNRPFSVYHDWRAETYENDATLDVDLGGNAFSIIGWGYAAVTYKKNLNLIFDNVSSLSQSKGSNNVTINGALQVIHQKALTYSAPTNFVVDESKKWEMITDSADMIDVTSTAGTFNVNGDKTLYAYNGDVSIYYSVNGELTVPAGKWYVTDDLDGAKAAVGDVTGWNDNGSGKLTGVLDAPVVAGTYFVMYGGTGLGKTPGSPSGSIADVIARIENDDSVTEGTIYVINNTKYADNYIKSGEEIRYLVWDANNSSHTKKITFKGAKKDTTAASGYVLDKDAAIVGFKKIMNADISLVGPTAFDNITLIRPRSVDAGFSTQGYDVSITDTVSFKQITGDYDTMNYGSYEDASTSANARNGGYGNMFKLGSGYKVSTGKGGRVTLRHNGPFTISTDWQDTTYDNDVVIDVDLNGGAFKLHWTTDTASVLYKKNVSLVLGDISSFDQSAQSSGKVNDVPVNNLFGSVTVKGDFNIIHKNIDGFNADLPTSVKVEGDIYELATEAAGIVDVTATSGVFQSLLTDDSKALLAKRAVGDGEQPYYYTSAPDGTLTLPEAGKYFVSVIDRSAVVTIDFDGEYTAYGYLNGEYKLPAHDNTSFQKFAGWKLGDNTYAAGSLATLTAANVAFTTAWIKLDNQTSIFVDNTNGDDSKAGTQDAPVKTLAKAFELVNATSDAVKNVVIIGTYAYSGNLPANSSLVTICGDGSGNSLLDLNNDYIKLAGDIKLENIKLSETTTAGGKKFASNGHKLIIGKGVVNSETAPMGLRLGTDTADSPKQVAEFHSGSFSGIDLGTYYVEINKTHSMAGADILVNGATIGAIYLQADGYGETVQGTNKFTDNVRFTVNSGSLGKVEVGQRQADYAAGLTFQFLANNGIQTSVNVGTKFAHNYIVSAEKQDGCSLEYTDTIGKYKVNGTKTAVAVQNGVQIAVSNKGFITIPEGTTTVKFVDKIDYIYDKAAGKLTFYDCAGEFDLASITPYVPTGKVFLGWKNSDGSYADKVAEREFEESLTAAYTDLITDIDNVNANFYIKGAQVRRASTAGETPIKQGLRYIVDIKDSFKNVLGTDVALGTLVLPTDLTRGHDMKLDPATEEGLAMYNEYLLALPEKVNGTGWVSGSWNSINDGPAVVKAEKIFGRENNGTQYTVCLTDIEKENYETYYSVKGYVVYTDYQGIKRVAYTDYYQTNIYKVAKEAIANGESDTAFTTIVNYYENQRMSAYEEMYSRTDLKNTRTNDKVKTWAETEGAATLDGIRNTDFFKYSNGLIVREVEYTLFGDGRDPVTIIQAGDTHLNYVNDRDWEEQSNCILATYKGRAWNRNGSSVPAINIFMKYGSMFDKMVVTGDVLDYFSWGCGEMVQKLITDRSDGILMAIGNHEPAIHMQDVAHTCNTSSDINDVHARLAEFWPNDTKYYSEIMKNEDGQDMVMLVVLDNEKDKYYWDGMDTWFAERIEEAREKNLKILIFEHDPLTTRAGLEDDYVNPFYEKGDISAEHDGYYAGNFGTTGASANSMKSGTDNIDSRVYKLITENADVVRGVFCGHWHNFMYSEIKGKTQSGDTMMIPQYIASANAYGARVTKITIK